MSEDFETLKQQIQWDFPIYDLDGKSVFGWKGLTQEIWDKAEDFFVIPIPESDAYVALPQKTAVVQNFVKIDSNGDVFDGRNYHNIWDFFINFGDNEFVLFPEEKTINRHHLDFKEFDQKAKNTEAITMGTKCLDDYSTIFKNTSPITAVTEPYKRFLQNVSNIVNSAGVAEDKEKGLKVTLKKEHLQMANEAEWAKSYGDSNTTRTSSMHNLYCSLSIEKQNADGKYSEIYRNPKIKVASIPAMNLERGLFLYKGKEYAMTMYADPLYNGMCIETAGMAFQKMLKEYLSNITSDILKKLSNTGLTSSEIDEKLFKSNSKHFSLISNNPFSKMLSGEGPYAERWRFVDDAKSGPIGIMRASMTVLTPPLLETINIDNKEPVLVNKKENINYYLSDILDFYTNPNGKKITSSSCLGIGVRIDDYGIPYLPCYKMKDGSVVARGKENVKWFPVHRIFNVKNGTELTKNMVTMDDYVIAHPEDLLEDGSKCFEEQILVKTNNQKTFAYEYKPSTEATLCTISSSCNRAPGSESNTDPAYEEKTRAAIKGSNEASSVLSPYNSLGPLMCNCPEGVNYHKPAYADFDGTVINIKEDSPFAGVRRFKSMIIKSDDGRMQFVNMDESRFSRDASIYRHIPSNGIEVGQSVKKGQVLTDIPGVVDGKFVVGTPAVAAFIPMGSITADDCIAISQSFADRMKIERRYSKEIEIRSSAGMFGPSLIFNPLDQNSSEKTKFGYDCSHLDSNGIVKEGEYIYPGDLIAFQLVPDGTKIFDAGERRIVSNLTERVPFEKIPLGYKIDPIVYDGKAPGFIKVRKEKTEYEGVERLIWDSVSYEPLRDGDKISIDGVKGTVQVISDENCPVITQEGKLNGIIPDVMLNATSYINRKAPGVLVRGLAGIIGLMEEKRIDIPKGTRNVSKDIRKYMEKLNIPEDGLFEITSKNGSLIRGTLNVLQVMNVNHPADQAHTHEGKALSNLKLSILQTLGVDDLIEKKETIETVSRILKTTGIHLGKKPISVDTKKLSKNNTNQKKQQKNCGKGMLHMPQ